MDNPQLGGEVGAISGLLGLTLATVNDGRFLWGTPDDVPARVDRENLARQSSLVCGLASSLANDPFGLPESLPRNGFATLRNNFDPIEGVACQPHHLPAGPGWGVVIHHCKS